MTHINWMKDVKLAGASALATTTAAVLVPCSPLWAADMIFASGSGAPSAANDAGEQQISSGIVQLKLDDGTTVSIMGPARFSLSSDGQLTVASGSFTASTPASGSPRPIIAGNGSQVILQSGSSASGKIATDGSFSGFALTGRMQVASNGSSRRFSAGNAFRASANFSPSAIVTAGAQPNRSGRSTPLQQIRQAQQGASQYLANANQTSPTSLGFAGVQQTQNFSPSTLTAATTPAQIQALVQAQTGPLDPVVALQFITEILTAIQSTGGLGSYNGLSPIQIQALLFNLQTFGAPTGLSQFQLEELLHALGDAGFNVTGITGSGPSFGSIADLLALISSGGMIPPGDPTIQSLIDILFANPFPPGVDANEVADLLRLAGYNVPDGFGSNTGGTPTPSPTPTPTPTPTPPPTFADSDGVRPGGDRDDIIIAFAVINETGLAQDVSLIFENDEFVGYRRSSGFEVRFDDRNEVEKSGDQGIIGWLRLAGGTKVGAQPRGDNSGDHFVYGIPLVNRPAEGLLTYELIGATSPTIRDDSLAPGSFDGQMAVSFSPTEIFMGLNATVLFSSDVYDILTEGGLTAPSIRVTPDGRFSGTADLPDGVGIACNQGDCRFVFDGFLAGDAASHAGLAYTIRDDRGNNVTKWIDGIAAFRKTGDGGGDPGGPPPSGGTREGQYVAYAAGNNIGIDARNPADVTYADSDGAIIGYVSTRNDFTTENERPKIGTAKNFESGNVSEIISWTRWADGTTGGRFFSADDGIEFGPNQGWHIVAGAPVTNIPTTGTVTYELVGSTAPTIRDGSIAPGTFDGNLAVAFGAIPMVGLNFDINIGGDAYRFGTPGGAADPTDGGRPIETTGDFANTFGSGQETFLVTGNGPICGGSGDCTAGFRGFLAGEGASHIGVSYTFGNGDFEQRVDGVAAFGTPGFSATAANSGVANWSGWNRTAGNSWSHFKVDHVSISGRVDQTRWMEGNNIFALKEQLSANFAFE